MCISTPDMPPPPPPPPPPALPPQERVRPATPAKTRSQLRKTGAKSLRIPLMSGGGSGLNVNY